jgi:nicotinamidase-related amidase
MVGCHLCLQFVVTLLACSTGVSFGFVPFYSRWQGHQSTRLIMSAESDSSSSTTTASIAKLDPAATAFVFIEYQNEFCSPGGKLHEAVKACMEQTNMLENSMRAVTMARDAGCTIVHVPIEFETGHPEISKSPYGVLAGIKEGGAFTSGQWGSDFCAGMRPAPGDLVVKGKKGLCGFASTNLEFLLGQSGARNLVLAGFLTNCCVESTMRYVAISYRAQPDETL